MGSKKEIKNVDSSKYIGFIVIACILLFTGSFVYKFIASDNNSSQRWCANCNTWHDINDDTIEGEVWCNNCQTWHAPNEESSTPSIK
tara:strand:- start:167 stop:427 length:261 start_codon:yes stop_codon:yes gene_type:complete